MPRYIFDAKVVVTLSAKNQAEANDIVATMHRTGRLRSSLYLARVIGLEAQTDPKLESHYSKCFTTLEGMINASEDLAHHLAQIAFYEGEVNTDEEPPATADIAYMLLYNMGEGPGRLGKQTTMQKIAEAFERYNGGLHWEKRNAFIRQLTTLHEAQADNRNPRSKAPGAKHEKDNAV